MSVFLKGTKKGEDRATPEPDDMNLFLIIPGEVNSTPLPPLPFPSPSHVDPLWFRGGFANAAQPHARLTRGGGVGGGGGGFWAPEDLKRRAGFQSCVISSGVAGKINWLLF